MTFCVNNFKNQLQEYMVIQTCRLYKLQTTLFLVKRVWNAKYWELTYFVNSNPNGLTCYNISMQWLLSTISIFLISIEDPASFGWTMWGGGGARSAYPLGPLLSNFMQISGIWNGKIIRLARSPCVWNSWSRVVMTFRIMVVAVIQNIKINSRIIVKFRCANYRPTKKLDLNSQLEQQNQYSFLLSVCKCQIWLTCYNILMLWLWSFLFHADFGKNGKVIGWRPLPCLCRAHPSLGNPGSATDRVNFRQWYHRFYLYYNSVSSVPENLKKKWNKNWKKNVCSSLRNDLRHYFSISKSCTQNLRSQQNRKLFEQKSFSGTVG